MKETLKNYLDNDKLIDGIIKYKKYLSENTRIENIMQTALWKSQYEDTDEILYVPLVDFNDDLQPLNSIGKHSSAYSVGAVYSTPSCLPPVESKEISKIKTSLLYFTGDKNRLGNEIILKPHINILRELAHGLDVTCHKKIKQIKLIMHVSSGDNKAKNDIHGFQKSFSSGHPCVTCKASFNELASMVEEDESMLRTKENYSEDLEVKAHGVIKRSVYESLENFHVLDNVAPDIMHNEFEGELKISQRFSNV